jgi:hypothetical protein
MPLLMELKNILIFVSTNMSRLRRWKFRGANFSVEREFCPEWDNLKIAGFNRKKFQAPQGRQKIERKN